MTKDQIIEEQITDIQIKLRNNKVDCCRLVYPCVKGEVKTGNICTSFNWLSDNSIKHAALERKRIYSTDPNKVLRFYEKNIKPELRRIDAYIRLLSVYRESGLIPKRVAKRHAKALRKRYGDKWRLEREGLNYAIRQCARYVMKWAKCPKCGERGFQETIVGVECNNCTATWNDMEPRSGVWCNVT